MPYFDTSQEWFKQSSLLIDARPTTTRLSSRWSLPKPGSSSSQLRSQKRKTDDKASASEAATSTTTLPSATFILKTYDPVSGVTLKYRTDQAAEVGRLVALMGRLGRSMAALPDEGPQDDTTLPEASVGEQGTGTNTPVPEAAGGGPKTGTGGGGGQGGGKKKKKGKR